MPSGKGGATRSSGKGGGAAAPARAPQPRLSALSMAEELARKRASLNAVSPDDIHDSSRVVTAPGLDSEESFREYQSYMQAFNIERWLDRLGSTTFDTELVPITQEEARAFITLHKGEGEPADAREAAAALMGDLAGRLQAGMDRVRGAGQGCFVKTSSRSAKDHAEPERIRTAVAEVLGRLPARDENAQMIALSYASMELLQFHEAARVLDVFVGSERCWHDMELALAQEVWDESLVARRWVALEPDMEFRCFVAGGRLTAVSQYRHLVHFPRLVSLRDRLLEGLVRFFEDRIRGALLGCFRDDNYVVDLAVELEGGDPGNILDVAVAGGVRLGRWWCIEVNPFYETTDGCLFSWGKERAIIEGTAASAGGAPAFRLRERPAKGALSLVYGSWKSALDGAKGGHEGPRRHSTEPAVSAGCLR